MKTAHLSICIVVIGGALAAATAPARAQATAAPAVTGGDDRPWNQGVPVATREAARALFLEGNRLFKVPVFSRAAERYRAALAMWKHPAFHFNLALAELNLGQEVEAHEHLAQALAHGAEPLGAEQFQEAQKQLRETERHLGRLRVACQTRGAEVALDGVPLFTGPGHYDGWVEPKAHEITAKKQDYLSEARRTTIAPGQLAVLELKLVTLSEATDTSRRWATWKPWIVVAAGAAIAAGGGVFHALSSRNFDRYDQDFVQLPCSKTTGCTEAEIGPALSDRLSRANRQQQFAVAGYVAGGAVIATGVVLLYMNRPRLLEQGAARSSGRVAVVPTISREGLGVLVSVSR